MINKNQYRVNKNKKILHKIGKEWKVVSVALLVALGGGALVSHHANADAVNHNQQKGSAVTNQNSKPAVQQPSSTVSVKEAQPSTAQSAPVNRASNIVPQAQALHRSIVNHQVSSNQDNHHVIPEDRPVNKTANNNYNTFSFNNNSFTPFHFANRQSPVQQRVAQRNRFNFAVYGRNSTNSDEDFSPIPGAYYSPKDDKFHVGTKPKDNDIVKSYGGFKDMDYTETKQFSDYYDSVYKKSGYSSPRYIKVEFTDGVMPNDFTLDQSSHTKTGVDGKTISVNNIPSDIENADELIFDSDIDTSHVKNPSDVRQNLLAHHAILPTSFLNKNAYESDVSSIASSIASFNADVNQASLINASASQNAVSASNFQNSSDLISASVQASQDYSNMDSELSMASSNESLASANASNFYSASSAKNSSDEKADLVTIESESSSVTAELSNANQILSNMPEVNRGAEKTVDHIIFNGDSSDNYTIHGFSDDNTVIKAPQGFHFSDGNYIEQISLNNSSHQFNVDRDVDYNQINSDLSTAQSNVNNLGNLINQANEQSELQAQNASDANQYVNSDQLNSANAKDSQIASQISNLLNTTKSAYQYAKHYAHAVRYDANSESQINSDIEALNHNEDIIKNAINQANNELHNMPIVSKGNKKPQPINVSYRYNGTVVKDYTTTDKNSFNSNVPQGYYIENTQQNSDGDVVINLGSNGTNSTSSNTPIPVAPINSDINNNSDNSDSDAIDEQLQIEIDKLKVRVIQLVNELDSMPPVNSDASDVSASSPMTKSVTKKHTNNIQRPARKHIRKQHKAHKNLPTITVDQMTNQTAEKVPTSTRHLQIKRNVLLHNDVYSVGSSNHVVGHLPKINGYVRVVGLYCVNYHGNLIYRYEVKINGHYYYITANDNFVEAI